MLCFHIVFVVVHACAHDQYPMFISVGKVSFLLPFWKRGICVCYFVWPWKYFGHIMLWVCCCPSVHNVFCVLVDHDQSWSNNTVHWHGIKAGINFVYCSSTRFQTTDTNMQKWVLLFFVFLDQDSRELFPSPDICPLNFAFWSSREPLGQIGSTLMWYSLGGLLPKCVRRHCPTSKMMP